MSENCLVLSPEVDVCVLGVDFSTDSSDDEIREDRTFRAWDHISKLLDVLSFVLRQYERRGVFRSR